MKENTSAKKTESKVDLVLEPEVEPILETEAESEPEVKKVGVVIECMDLNVRKAPERNAEIVCTIPCLTEVVVGEKESTNEFYKIDTASGVSGFCMKKYISIKQ